MKDQLFVNKESRLISPDRDYRVDTAINKTRESVEPESLHPENKVIEFVLKGL